MSLNLKKRGRYWYIYGTVAVGDKKETIKETSTRLANKSEAEHFCNSFEKSIRDELLFGKKRDPAADITVEDANTQWEKLNKPGHAQRSISKSIQCALGIYTTLAEIDTAKWMAYRAGYLYDKKPATIKAHKAVIRYYFTSMGLEPPKMPAPKSSEFKEIKLLERVANELIQEYPNFATGPGVFARYSGMRVNEIIRAKVEHALEDRPLLKIPDTKTDDFRYVPIHNKMRVYIEAAKKNGQTYIFEENEKPYPFNPDKPSNPFYNVHRGACKRLGIKDFTWHDWRHHWAYTAVEGGLDIKSLMKVGGWKNLETVSRYLAPNLDRAIEVITAMK